LYDLNDESWEIIVNFSTIACERIFYQRGLGDVKAIQIKLLNDQNESEVSQFDFSLNILLIHQNQNSTPIYLTEV
jgi:hypothetical protein